MKEWDDIRSGKRKAEWHFLAERYMKVQNGLLQSSGILVAPLLLREDGTLSELVYAPVFY